MVNIAIESPAGIEVILSVLTIIALAWTVYKFFQVGKSEPVEP